ncbi:hypothetical protein AALA82_01330 [Oscillospiraceae bacterium 50-16]
MKLYDNDSYRDTFTEGVYELLSGDTTWDRANQIIDLFDGATVVEVPDAIQAAHPQGGPGDDSIEIVHPDKGNPHTYLKPCRICGNTEIVYERYKHQAGERWRCWCTKCLACIDPGWAQDRLAVRDIWNQEPPNDPLTLGELLALDGEPVWIESHKVKEWALVFVEGGFCRTSAGNVAFLSLYKKSWIAYRRKPEEVNEP